MGIGLRPRTSSNGDPRSRSARIVVALGAGVFVGLFFGERVSGLQVWADAYIKLLQMTVLPYITVSLIAGVGSLAWNEARTIGLRVVGVFALLWSLALTAVFLFPLMFPPHETASFFSTTLVEPSEPFDVVSLYIPANPFNSLANAIVPAVVLFSMIIGVALITVPHKARLLDVLAVANAAIAKATGFIVALNPYGVFLIAAVAAGTLTLDDFERLQVYMASYVAISLLLSLWILPALVATLTPIPYRAVLARTHNALVTAFMTSSLLAVLPLLIDDAKALLHEYANLSARRATLPDIIVPASFNFPHSGKLLSLSFVLFAAWFSGTSLSALDYPRLAGAGWLALFGNVNMAVPFLLGLLRIPATTFNLFVATSVVNARFGTLTAAVHTVAVSLLGTCAVAGLLHVDRRKLVRFGIVTLVLTVTTVGGLRVLFAHSTHGSDTKDTVLESMHMLRETRRARVFRRSGEAAALPQPDRSVLESVRHRRSLRVGYLDDSLPYSFFNGQQDLVGFDVEMAYQLARDLDVALEFTPVTRAFFDDGLDPTTCDLVMSGTVVTADRMLSVLFSASYLDETIAFLVPDHRRADFTQWDHIRRMGRLRLGVPQAAYFLRQVSTELPGAEIVPISHMADIFSSRAVPLDAFVVTAERGSAYTLLHPEYAVAVPQPRPSKIPLAYVVAGRDQALARLLDEWIELKRKDGTIDQLFAHWILGQDATAKPPRWSIAHDVLHWADR